MISRLTLSMPPEARGSMCDTQPAASDGDPQCAPHAAFGDALECSARTADAKDTPISDDPPINETAAANNSAAPFVAVGVVAMTVHSSTERDAHAKDGNAADTSQDVRVAAFARQPSTSRHPASDRSQFAFDTADVDTESNATPAATAAIALRHETHHRAAPDRARSSCKGDLGPPVSQRDAATQSTDISARSLDTEHVRDVPRDAPGRSHPQPTPTDTRTSRGDTLDVIAPMTPTSVDHIRASAAESAATTRPDLVPRQTSDIADHSVATSPASGTNHVRPLQHLQLRLTSSADDDISLKLALQDGALDVTIVTADAALSRYLTDERSTLLTSLTVSGYAVDTIAVEHRPADHAEFAASSDGQPGTQQDRQHARRHAGQSNDQSAAGRVTATVDDGSATRASAMERVV